MLDEDEKSIPLAPEPEVEVGVEPADVRQALDWLDEGQTAKLLILSQVVLSLQLPFAVVPLVMLTASKAKMGELVAPRWLTVVAAVIAAIIIVLNLKLIFDVATGA